MPLDPAIKSFLAHPDHLTISSFSLGLVALLAFHYLERSTRVGERTRNFLEGRCGVGLKGGDDEESSERLDVDGKRMEKEVNPEKREIEQDFFGGQWSRDLEQRTWEREGEGRRTSADPTGLVKWLNTLVLVQAIGMFSTLLVFTPGAATGCAFLTGWNVLTSQGIHIVAPLHIVLVEIRDRGIAWPYEVPTLYVSLALRLGLTIASAAVSPGVVTTLPPPFPATEALCLAKRNLFVGSTTVAFDLTIAVYFIIRVSLNCAMREMREGRLVTRLMWSVVRRGFAKVATNAIFVAAGAAGWLGRTNLAGSLVPPTLALLIVLMAFNSPSATPSHPPLSLSPARINKHQSRPPSSVPWNSQATPLPILTQFTSITPQSTGTVAFPQTPIASPPLHPPPLAMSHTRTRTSSISSTVSTIHRAKLGAAAFISRQSSGMINAIPRRPALQLGAVLPSIPRVTTAAGGDLEFENGYLNAMLDPIGPPADSTAKCSEGKNDHSPRVLSIKLNTATARGVEGKGQTEGVPSPVSVLERQENVRRGELSAISRN